MHMKIVLGLLVFAMLYQFGYTCSCLPGVETDEQKYCVADFVMVVKVKRKLKIPGGQQTTNAFYKVVVKEDPWKFPSGYDVPEENGVYKIYTGSNDGLCGVTQLKRRKYLISGSVESDGKMRIDSCNSIVDRKRRKLSKSQKELKNSPPDCTK